jgi:hypothetical protein
MKNVLVYDVLHNVPKHCMYLLLFLDCSDDSDFEDEEYVFI